LLDTKNLQAGPRPIMNMKRANLEIEIPGDPPKDPNDAHFEA